MALLRAGFFRELPHGEEGGPSLAVVRGQLSVEARRRVAGYLRGGSVLAATGCLTDDWFDSAATDVAPLEVRTDGAWAWSGDLSYYVEKYGVGVPSEFLSRMAARGWTAPELTREELLAMENDIFSRWGDG